MDSTWKLTGNAAPLANTDLLHQNLHFSQASPLPSIRVNIKRSVPDCFSHHGSQQNCCAHVSAWISSPNNTVPGPSLWDLLTQLVLPWLDLWTSGAQSKACCLLSILASFCLKWEPGGREPVSFVWLLCRCLLFKQEVSSCFTHTQIFPCWGHFFFFLENQNRDYDPLMASLSNIKGCCESESRPARVDCSL